MTRYARIEAGVVAELLDTTRDIATLFPASLVWVPASAQVAQGWTFSNGTLVAPPVVPFDPQADAMTELLMRLDRIEAAITVAQADYLTAGDTVNAAACQTAKAQIDALPADATILATTSRAAFNAAARTRLQAIAQGVPPAVRQRVRRSDPAI